MRRSRTPALRPPGAFALSWQGRSRGWLRRFLRWTPLGLALLGGAARGQAAGLEVRVLADEIITTTTPADNNTTPMWAVGAPMLVRQGGTVWASIPVHDAGFKPYCNTHWELWRRPESGPWTKLHQGEPGSEREPCPIFLLDETSLAVSMHPRLLSRRPDSGGKIPAFCQPALGIVQLARPEKLPRLITPAFAQPAVFTEHSYRSVGADPSSREFLLHLMGQEDVYHTVWRDAGGAWHPLREPGFPVRACYANVALRRRAAHLFAVGDIREPNPAWREEKTRVLRRDWDYVFRQVYHSWSPDLSAEPFRPPLEVDTVEETAGWLFNLDLLVDAQDRVHLLWVRWNIQYSFLRDKFFPGEPMVESVVHGVLEEGRLVARREIFRRILASTPAPFTSGRLHELADGRLIAVLVAEAGEGQADAERGLWLQPIDPRGGSAGEPVRVALSRPPPSGFFFTNTARGGSERDDNLDVLAAEPGEAGIGLRHVHLHVR